MKKSLFLFIGFLIFYSVAWCGERSVSIKGRWFFVDGERFFVKGIAYSGQRPGESPGVGILPLERVKKDFQLIKEAGFNTIRVWTPRQVKLAGELGLMVIYEVWVDQSLSLDGEHLDTVINRIQHDIPKVIGHQNLLMINIFNEPRQGPVLEQSEQDVQSWLATLVKTIKSIQPDIPVSLAQWNPIAYMNQDLWDVTCFNSYFHSPNTNSYSCGPQNYVRALIERDGITHPFINSEHSVLVSPTEISKIGKYGYGGNKPEDQGRGTIELAEELVGGGVTGHIVLHFIDSWWLRGTPLVQDDHPEEHLGIASIGDKGKVVLKPAYHEIKKYNQAILIEPRPYNLYSVKKKVPIAITVTPTVAKVGVSIDGGAFKPLPRNSEHWFQSHLTLMEGARKIRMKAMDAKNKVIEEKETTFFMVPDRKDYQLKVTMEPEEEDCILIRILALDPRGKPLSRKQIKVSIFYGRDWIESQFERTTDNKGMVVLKQYEMDKPYLIEIGAGMEVERYGRKYWVGGFLNKRVD